MNAFNRNETVGFAGLGVMGAPMARWLLQKGWKTAVYARRAEAAAPLVAAGAQGCATPAALGQACRLVILCLTDAAAVEDVVFGRDGVAQGMAAGGAIVDTSTIAATSARALAQRLAGRGITYLDAPISGGQLGAEAGTLACMIGGESAAVDAVREVLGAFSRSVTHVGACGAGQTVKACNQVAAAGALLGVSDAIALARSQGVDPEVMRQVLLNGTARSFVLEKDGARIIQSAFTPGFRARLMRKDLRIAMETVAGVGTLRAAPVVERALDALCEAGQGDLDWSAAGG